MTYDSSFVWRPIVQKNVKNVHVDSSTGKPIHELSCVLVFGIQIGEFVLSIKQESSKLWLPYLDLFNHCVSLVRAWSILTWHSKKNLLFRLHNINVYFKYLSEQLGLVSPDLILYTLKLFFLIGGHCHVRNKYTCFNNWHWHLSYICYFKYFIQKRSVYGVKRTK